MKPTPSSPSDAPLLVAFGAHPDDIEFGCGGVIVAETQAGRRAHLVVCSLGEAGTNGTPAERRAEALAAASALGASIEFIDLGGDAHLENNLATRLAIAAVLRRLRPGIVLAPTPEPNQHPDHAAIGQAVRDASRLARYGGLAELKAQPAHAIDQLLFYAVTSHPGEGLGSPFLYDVSAPAVLSAWSQAMQAHGSQLRTRNYLDLQLGRARAEGLRAGVEHAIPLYPNDPLLVSCLAQVARAARRF